ncbi:MAG TPA: hypothetical protein DEA55_07755 [Rhodospirillaceae bacterium]|nr:hypothetical protein [Rhodospirillaceae bacterium]
MEPLRSKFDIWKQKIPDFQHDLSLKLTEMNLIAWQKCLPWSFEAALFKGDDQRMLHVVVDAVHSQKKDISEHITALTIDTQTQEIVGYSPETKWISHENLSKDFSNALARITPPILKFMDSQKPYNTTALAAELN